MLLNRLLLGGGPGGAFVQAELVVGPNIYAFVRNNPVSKIDLHGLFQFEPIISTPSIEIIPNFLDTCSSVGDFVTCYRDMRDANTIGADKYFHCLANCR